MRNVGFVKRWDVEYGSERGSEVCISFGGKMGFVVDSNDVVVFLTIEFSFVCGCGCGCACLEYELCKDWHLLYVF